MLRRAATLIVFCLAAKVAWAQAAQKECFTKAEEKAEQIVRDGVRLREGAMACDGRPYYKGTLPLWQQVDQRFGAQFAQQTKIRENAFKREFADDAENTLGMWNGRIVLHYRNYPYSDTYCDSIKIMLDNMTKKGWSVLAKQAGAGKDEVAMDYRLCK
jgi:hypothetical protein